jgi:hypothetical protein
MAGRRFDKLGVLGRAGFRDAGQTAPHDMFVRPGGGAALILKGSIGFDAKGAMAINAD